MTGSLPPGYYIVIVDLWSAWWLDRHYLQVDDFADHREL